MQASIFITPDAEIAGNATDPFASWAASQNDFGAPYAANAVDNDASQHQNAAFATAAAFRNNDNASHVQVGAGFVSDALFPEGREYSHQSHHQPTSMRMDIPAAFATSFSMSGMPPTAPPTPFLQPPTPVMEPATMCTNATAMSYSAQPHTFVSTPVTVTMPVDNSPSALPDVSVVSPPLVSPPLGSVSLPVSSNATSVMPDASFSAITTSVPVATVVPPVVVMNPQFHMSHVQHDHNMYVNGQATNQEQPQMPERSYDPQQQHYQETASAAAAAAAASLAHFHNQHPQQQQYPFSEYQQPQQYQQQPHEQMQHQQHYHEPPQNVYFVPNDPDVSQHGLLPTPSQSSASSADYVFSRRSSSGASTVSGASSFGGQTMSPTVRRVSDMTLDFSASHIVAKKKAKTVERTFNCEFQGCGMQFKRAEHLSRHRLLHTGEKPFSCPYEGCDKTFSRKDNLAAHLRTHKRREARALAKSNAGTMGATSKLSSSGKKSATKRASSLSSAPSRAAAATRSLRPRLAKKSVQVAADDYDKEEDEEDDYDHDDDIGTKVDTSSFSHFSAATFNTANVHTLAVPDLPTPLASPSEV